MQMCPNSNIEDEMRDKNHFEKDKYGNGFEKLAVKKLIRSAAGFE